MKKNFLKESLSDLTIKIASNSFGKSTFFGCYEVKIPKELKELKKNQTDRK